jgi:hypothetical protein
MARGIHLRKSAVALGQVKTAVVQGGFSVVETPEFFGLPPGFPQEMMAGAASSMPASGLAAKPLVAKWHRRSMETAAFAGNQGTMVVVRAPV